MIKVSIIIRAFNESKHIVKLLRGIGSQKWQGVLEDPFEIEIVLVDSGSTDNTVSLSLPFGVRLVTIKPEDFTFGRSLNLGIQVASGDYIAMISAHCYPVDDFWLAHLVAPLVQEPKAGLSYGKQRGNEVTKYSEHQIFARWFPDRSERHYELPFCNNANAAIRRSLWMLHPYNETLAALEDMEWGRFALARGYHIAYQASASVVHVHEETYKQVYRRYYREALAFRQIFPGETFSFCHFLRYWTTNIAADLWSAGRPQKPSGDRQNNLWLLASSIVRFRTMQFWATYRGHNERRPIGLQMSKRLFYPHFMRLDS